MLIEKSSFKRDYLKNVTVLLTGGGGGIGYEAARALTWLGANVVIAEIDTTTGMQAQTVINKELNTDKVWFYPIDICNVQELDKMKLSINNRFGAVDVIFNNATVTPFGAIESVSIQDWDQSYFVNVRAPVLLIQKFLPDMLKRNAGVIVFVPSSGAAPYMGAYEVFKTAQVELCNTLAGEMEDTNIITYAIGPGLVKTKTAQKGIETIARLMNMSTEEFYRDNEGQILDAEAAGTGFAISVALAKQYNGQEIGSIQALMDGGVYTQNTIDRSTLMLNEEQREEYKLRLGKIVETYTEQYKGWFKRNIFERQWVLRDFKKTTGMSVDEMKSVLLQLSMAIEKEDYSTIDDYKGQLYKLKIYYEKQHKLLQGYEKDPQKLQENSGFIISWIEDLDKILSLSL
ncbi:NAD(P)-dependent dehydrogenase (short-subunit alcohol dehydrogenase family) [Paenibacillus anaericanus]|uniref:SDR family oxidoreductase n=1 Tax=Paenibacillus anaericanus TaxID=170367 RepID=UPI002789175E|nr:SDR family oxidoreductase [Paenibacillus anaericanus]MDQ0091432.1 NAD(P)-dependent dehydrogenase (short-subunit alcohol dehydrogenase family) [Paenibacillus anaericanus]